MSDFYISASPQSGRPDERRSDTEEAVYDFLDKLGISYERVDHDEAATIDCCHDVENVLGAKIVKNLFLCNSQKTSFYMLIMPGGKVFKTKDLSKQIGSARLSFAGAEFMQELLLTAPGSMSVFGLLFDEGQKVRLLIDKDILSNEYIGFHPCKNTSTLKLKTSDITDIFIPASRHEPTFVELPVYSL